MSKEIPPTDGLPLLFKDLFPQKTQSNLARILSELLGIPTPALTCSGTVAFIIALETLHELEPQRTQVILPAWTCPLVALAVEKIGFTPILCDLAPNSLEFDLKQLSQLSNTSTLAIVATHFAGLVCDLIAIQKIAHQHGIYLIEDAAQAMGAKTHTQSVGLIGDISFFSLAFGKGLTSAEGGVLFSRHLELHRKLLKNIAQLPTLHGWEIKRCLELIGYYCLYRPSSLSLIYGHNLRKALKNNDEISAVGDDFDRNSIPIHQLGKWRSAVAASATQRLATHWQSAQQRATYRIQRLKQIPHLQVFEEQLHTTATYPFLLILVDQIELCKEILDELWTRGLGVTKLFVRAINQYPALAHIPANTPNAIDFAARSFTISNSVWLDDDRFEQVIEILQKHCINKKD